MTILARHLRWLFLLGLVVSCGGKTDGDPDSVSDAGGANGSGGTTIAAGGGSGGGGAAGTGGFDDTIAVGGVTNTACVDDALCDTCLLHVRPDGSDSNDGTTWNRAFASVQMGLDVASATITASLGYSSCEVWVAEGTYLPTTLADETDPHSAAFRLREQVGLYGGFSGTESRRDERNAEEHETILSGDLGVVGDSSDNSYYVVVGADASVLDGFTVTGGRSRNQTAWESGVPVESGTNFSLVEGYCAGMLNYDVSPAVQGCRFAANEGEGICNYLNEIRISDCTFSNSGIVGIGAQLSIVSVSGCIVSGSARFGIYSTDGTLLDVDNSVIVDNDGGIYVDGDWGEATITGSTIANNSEEALCNQNRASIRVLNSIVWGSADVDVTAIVVDVTANGHFEFTNSIVQGGYDGAGVIDADPLFVSPETGDYSLMASSPAIDAGDACSATATLTDVLGNPRWDIAGVGTDPNGLDLGAYEFQGAVESDVVKTEFNCE